MNIFFWPWRRIGSIFSSPTAEWRNFEREDLQRLKISWPKHQWAKMLPHRDVEIVAGVCIPQRKYFENRRNCSEGAEKMFWFKSQLFTQKSRLWKLMENSRKSSVMSSLEIYLVNKILPYPIHKSMNLIKHLWKINSDSEGCKITPKVLIVEEIGIFHLTKSRKSFLQ